MNMKSINQSIHYDSVFSHMYIYKGELKSSMDYECMYVLTFTFHLLLPVVGYSANEMDIVLYVYIYAENVLVIYIYHT